MATAALDSEAQLSRILTRISFSGKHHVLSNDYSLCSSNVLALLVATWSCSRNMRECNEMNNRYCR